MANSVLESYQDYRLAVNARNGGQSAEWPEIADELAALFEQLLGELPIDRPLRNAWAYPVRRPNGDWPNLVVMHQRSAPRPNDLQCDWRWIHYALVVLICGPWGNDPGQMQALGTQYIDPLVRVIDANQTLNRRVRSIDIGSEGLQWQVLTYGDPPRNQWYGLTLPLEIHGLTARTRGG